MNKETLINNIVKLLLGIIGFFIVNSYNNLRQEIMTFQTDIKTFQTDIKKLEISVLELQVKLETYATKEEVRKLLDGYKN